MTEIFQKKLDHLLTLLNDVFDVFDKKEHLTTAEKKVCEGACFIGDVMITVAKLSSEASTEEEKQRVVEIEQKIEPVMDQFITSFEKLDDFFKKKEKKIKNVSGLYFDNEESEDASIGDIEDILLKAGDLFGVEK